jgi:predicted MFS family arabinose efflux permease
MCTTTTINLFTIFMQTLIVVFAVRDLGISPGWLGIYYAVSGIGGFVGSLGAKSLERRLGVGVLLLVGCLLYCVPDLIVPAIAGGVATILSLLMVQSFLTGAGVVIQNISIAALFTSIVPAPERASVRGCFQSVSFGVRSVGALVCGALSTSFGVRQTLLIGALGASAAVLWLLPSPLLSFRLPADVIA